MSKEYYQILNVSPIAAPDQVKAAFRRLVRQHHPDTTSGVDGDDAQLFNDINEAYDVLNDVERRQEYDRQNPQLFEGLELPNQNEDAPESEPGRAEAQPAQPGSLRHSTFGSAKDWQRLQDLAGSDEQEGQTHGLSRSRFYSAEVDISFPDAQEAESRLDRFRRGLRLVFGRSDDKTAATPGASVSRIRLLDEADIEQKAKQGTDMSPSMIEEQLRGSREFQFTISSIEALAGTTRDLAVEGPDGPISIPVEIPRGVRQRSTLRIQAPPIPGLAQREFAVKIIIAAHPLVEFEEDDINVRLPITIGEAVNGAEIDVPTLTGLVKVQIPSGWSVLKKLRVKGHGLELEDGNGRGDLFLKTYIVAPDVVTDATKAAAQAMDSSYSVPPRANIPRSLMDLTYGSSK